MLTRRIDLYTISFERPHQAAFYINTRIHNISKLLSLIGDYKELTKVIAKHYLGETPEYNIAALMLAILSIDDIINALRPFLRSKVYGRRIYSFQPKLWKYYYKSEPKIRLPDRIKLLARYVSPPEESIFIKRYLENKYKEYAEKIPYATIKALKKVVYTHYLNFPITTELFNINIDSLIYFDPDEAISSFLSICKPTSDIERWWLIYLLRRNGCKKLCLKKLYERRTEYSSFLWSLINSV